ncbi:hypothetical protein JZ785_19935 [Alicyclobacillus curvatus]|nr:hypothetical protein JZ785_19935 [Alicyclobacillus curvatus]
MTTIDHLASGMPVPVPIVPFRQQFDVSLLDAHNLEAAQSGGQQVGWGASRRAGDVGARKFNVMY